MLYYYWRKQGNALGVVLFVYDIMLMSKLTQTTLKELYCLSVRFFLS